MFYYLTLLIKQIYKEVKNIALSSLSIYYTWKNIKRTYNNNKFKISAPTWIDKFELPDGSYSVSDIQEYFEYILKKHGEEIDNPSIRIYVNKIENRITFKIKTEYYLELLTPDTIKLLGSTGNKITKIKMMKMFLIQRLQKQYQSIVTLLTMIINKIQEFCLHLFQVNHLVAYQKFHQQIFSF